jgi:hypothetical protein
VMEGQEQGGLFADSNQTKASHETIDGGQLLGNFEGNEDSPKEAFVTLSPSGPTTTEGPHNLIGEPSRTYGSPKMPLVKSLPAHFANLLPW